MITHHQLLNALWGPGHAQDMHYVRVHMFAFSNIGPGRTIRGVVRTGVTARR